LPQPSALPWSSLPAPSVSGPMLVLVLMRAI
jgi:hypothetical protein